MSRTATVAAAVTRTLRIQNVRQNRFVATQAQFVPQNRSAAQNHSTTQDHSISVGATLVNNIVDITSPQMNDTNVALLEQSLSQEDVDRTVQMSGQLPDIATEVVMQAGQTMNLSATAGVLALGGGGSLTEQSARNIRTRVQIQQNANFPESMAQSADNDDTQEPRPGFIRRNVACLTCGLIAVLVVAAFVIIVIERTSLVQDLGFISRTPDEKDETSDDDPSDKEIVETFNDAARDFGIDISQRFTKTQVKPLLKEAYSWYWMSEETFWRTKTPREIVASERCSTDNLIYQIVSLNSLIPHAMQLSMQKPDFTWIDPKDPAIISAVLISIYQMKGVNEMYDYMATYKYYNKALRRAVALEVVVESLSKMLSGHIQITEA